MPVSKKKLTEAIDRAETIYLWCWDAIQSNFAIENDDPLSTLLDFQPRLLSALSILGGSYREIFQEKNRIIRRKEKYKNKWFENRLRTLDRYLNIIRSAIGIGRAIGDGFAWIFYHSERDLIDEHLKLPRQDLLPPGVGGIGERAFAKQCQGIGGYVIISHAITSFLRLGDVSFVDPKSQKIIGIGELKTTHLEGDRYSIRLELVSGEIPHSLLSITQSTSTADEVPEFPSEMKLRLQRQMKQITESLGEATRRKDDQKLSFSSKYHFSELESAISGADTNNFHSVKAGKSLLICAHRLAGSQKLSSLLLGRKFPHLNKSLDAFRDEVLSILDPSFSDNALFLSDIAFDDDGFPIVLRGSIPVAWWPLDKKKLFEIIFHRVIAISIYNPAHFWALLRSKGYQTEIDQKSRLKSATTITAGRRVELHNFDYYTHLTQNFMMSDEAVFSMIESILESAAKQSPSSTVNIMPNFRMR